MAKVDNELLDWNIWQGTAPGHAFSGNSSQPPTTADGQPLASPSAKAGLPRVEGALRTRGLGLGKLLIIYGLIALAVLLPMLLPGYILTLDMVFTPELRMPDTVSSSYLFHAALHVLNFVLPGDVIQKMILFAILTLSGVGAHLLVRHIQTAKAAAGEFALWGAYIAGFLYMVNPYTYSRFMAGQYAVLLGYALLPFFVRAVLQFSAVPTLRRSLVASGWLVGIGIVSLHTLALAAILGTVALTVCAWRCWVHGRIVWKTITYGLAGIGAFVAASSYWLFPLLTGRSLQGQAAAGFNAGDQAAFATLGGDWLGKLGNILQLQGFWAEGQNLYLLPGEQLPVWPVVVLLFWTLIVAGLAWLWRHYRPMALIFVGAAAVAITLAITGLPSNVPLLAGLREPHKLVGVLALAYAVLAGLGAAAILERLKHNTAAFNGALIFVLLTPVLLTPTMFWGFAGQLSPRQYPGDWHVINQELNRDTNDFQVLSLPWHQYMHYPFAGRIIANPTETFFDKPVIVSNQLEFNEASPTFPDDTKRLLSEQIIPAAENDPEFGHKISELNIKYVLLIKTYDYQEYEYLDGRSDLWLLAETENIKLYRNTAYGE